MEPVLQAQSEAGCGAYSEQPPREGTWGLWRMERALAAREQSLRAPHVGEPRLWPPVRWWDAPACCPEQCGLSGAGGWKRVFCGGVAWPRLYFGKRAPSWRWVPERRLTCPEPRGQAGWTLWGPQPQARDPGAGLAGRTQLILLRPGAGAGLDLLSRRTKVLSPGFPCASPFGWGLSPRVGHLQEAAFSPCSALGCSAGLRRC